MELWIRSQDKKILLKVETIEVVNNWFFLNNKYNMGSYKTNEIALEVLDEIQKLLKPKLITEFKNTVKYNKNGTPIDTLIPCDALKKSEIQELSTYVYEMPED